MNARIVVVASVLALLCFLGEDSRAGVLTSENYADEPASFTWFFKWDGQIPSSTGVGAPTDTLEPDGQVEWNDVSAVLRVTLFPFEPDIPPVYQLIVKARHKISPPGHGHSANVIPLVINQNVTNLADSAGYTRFAQFAAESHAAHSDWMYLWYKKAVGEEAVSFKLEGKHLGKVVPEPASGMIAAGILASFTYMRRRVRRLER